MLRKILFSSVMLSLMFSGAAVDDPYLVGEVRQSGSLWQDNHGYTDVNGKTLRSTTINTGVKNLILIIAGQSLTGAEAPTAYTPTNTSVVDNFNVYDGGLYAYSDPPLGTTWVYLALGGSLPTPNTGSIGGRIADLAINAGSFARVIVVPIGVGGTTIAQWDSGPLRDRIGVAMRRLAAKNITPATTNVTFAILWMQGEGDHGTTTAAYKASLTNIQANAVAAGFSGRFFVSQETWLSGAVDSNVQSAQTSIVDGVKFWAGGNIDSLNNTNRLTDQTHPNDVGIAAAATLQWNAMHASGAPF